jgi:hypothetical protein
MADPDLRFLDTNVDYFLGSFKQHGLTGVLEAARFAISQMLDVQRAKNSEGQQSVYLKVLPKPLLPGTFTAQHAFSDDHELGVPTFKLMIGDNLGRPSYFCSAPIEALLAPIAVGTYTVYSHAFGNEGDPLRRYIGISRRGWGVRWGEHLAAAKGGSPYLFHEAIRRVGDGSMQVHEVYGVGLSFEDAMAAEERLVARASLYPKGLNMIPGGHAGLRYLAARGFDRVNARKWEYRHKLIREFTRHCERLGRPNPLMAARWRDAGYAATIICSNPNNFSVEDVANVRLLGSYGWEPEAIAEQMKCRVERVERLLRGSTYSRVQ